MIINNFFVITGAPGASKTTLIEALRKRGYSCVDEVARAVIKEQVATGKDGLPWCNNSAFINLMLERSIADYLSAAQNHKDILFFDRGIVDIVAHVYVSKLPISSELHYAVEHYRYNQMVFVAPLWQEIYHADQERKQTFKQAVESFNEIVKSYTAYGYTLKYIPKVSVEERVSIILNELSIIFPT